MMGNNKKEDVGIRTVRLARGSMAPGGTPPQVVMTPNGRTTFDRERSYSSKATSLSEGESPMVAGVNALRQVGVVELLEQDDRPTFIIDLLNPTNFQPGLIQVVYTNASLRAYGGLYEMVTGSHTDTKALVAAMTFADFKNWTTSFVKDHESLDVSLPSFHWASFTWSCATLRKRFRIFSGLLSSTGLQSHPPSVGTPSMHSNVHSRHESTQLNDLVETDRLGPQDYFGNAVLPRSVLVLTDASDVLGSTTNRPRDLPQEGEENNQPGRSPTTESSVSPKHPADHKDKNSPLSMVTEEAILGAASAGEIDSFTVTPQDQGFFDWTRMAITPAMPRHIQFARSVNWADTSLGPIENWPSALRGMCNLIMASPHPAAMYWGSDYVAIYNEAYIHLAGQKHPALMGQSYAMAWAEIWDVLEEVFATAIRTGESTMKDDDLIYIRRKGFLEETYFSWSIIPLVGDDGTVVGLYNPAFEKTRRKIAERRMLTLREVGERTAAAREVRGFWGQVLQGLDSNEFDTPFVLLYSVSDDSESDGSSIYSCSNGALKQCILEGTLPPLPPDHPAAPPQIDLKGGVEGFGRVFYEAMSTDRPVLLELETGTLDESLMQNMEWRGFGEMPRAAVVCPIHPTTGESIIGFLVMGINPRRPYDEDYSLFVQLLSRQLATSMASVVLFEEEIRRGQQAAKLAALDRIELSEQLAAKSQEAMESETRFSRMAEFAPVGMFIADSDGRTIFTNDSFHELSGLPKGDSTDNWIDSVKEEDKVMVTKMWDNLIENKIPMSAEFRFQASWNDCNGVEGDKWVLASAFPERYSDGTLKSVFGSITNISQQKWAEGLQKKRMEEAVELKRQQESFIDITSHEMRNPLSAIIMCADEIITSLTDYRSNGQSTIPQELIDSNIDAAQTIALCANHQTRIVSDVLTLSKLNSALLLVTPVDSRPMDVAKQAMKMFDQELQKLDLTMEFEVEESFHQMDIDWVRIDPSRLLQVLINLTTNAIKFTAPQSHRRIVLSMGASRSRPSQTSGATPSGVEYVPTRATRKIGSVDGADWGKGPVVYLHFAVRDTGKGLTCDEMKLLFLRFSQANPKTHVQYGGSGLGLFISRELVELQGGEIGVSSEAGTGSTFAFYIQGRRSPGPPVSAPASPARPHVSAPTPSVPRQTIATATADVESLSAHPPSSVSAPNARYARLHVLIVEDNLVNQRVLAKQLRALGCTVHIANHGGECIDQLRASRWWRRPSPRSSSSAPHPPLLDGDSATGAAAGPTPTAVTGVDAADDARPLDVILMDLEMPVMDGLTCATRIRALQRAGAVVGHVPIVAVTANARAEQINTALEAGMVRLSVFSCFFRRCRRFGTRLSFLSLCSLASSFRLLRFIASMLLRDDVQRVVVCVRFCTLCEDVAANIWPW